MTLDWSAIVQVAAVFAAAAIILFVALVDRAERGRQRELRRELEVDHERHIYAPRDLTERYRRSEGR